MKRSILKTSSFLGFYVKMFNQFCSQYFSPILIFPSLPLDPQCGVCFSTLYVLFVVALFTYRISYLIYLTDIDECTSKKHNCHVQSTCNNTIGGFMCTCNDGYWGDGITCTGTLVK